jgi:hypothetical protein
MSLNTHEWWAVEVLTSESEVTQSLLSSSLLVPCKHGQGYPAYLGYWVEQFVSISGDQVDYLVLSFEDSVGDLGVLLALLELKLREDVRNCLFHSLLVLCINAIPVARYMDEISQNDIQGDINYLHDLVLQLQIMLLDGVDRKVINLMKVEEFLDNEPKIIFIFSVLVGDLC